jgi:hypothetical protein
MQRLFMFRSLQSDAETETGGRFLAISQEISYVTFMKKQES